MKTLVSNITKYIDYITEKEKLFVSVHFLPESYRLLDEESLVSLMPYIAHNNPYCKFVRGVPERHGLCVKNQRKIVELLADADSIENTCYAAAKERAYAVRLGGAAIGFVTVSGYKGERGAKLSEPLWQTALYSEEIPRKLADTVIPPLVIMVEALVREEKSEANSELKEMLAYISENRLSLSLEKLAKHFGRSESYVSHIFKAKTGKSIRAYSNDLKLIEAHRLLKNGNLSVTEAGYEAGFSDTSYFIRLYKTKYGKTPHKYKKSLK